MSTVNTVFSEAIWCALIAGVVAIITSLINKIPAKKNTQDIRKVQLNEIYVPLEKLLQLDISALEKIAATQKIISEQYLIFPPAIKKEIDTLSKEPEPDLKKLTTMVHSYYEWTKRSLGYPCNEWDILSKYTPIRSRHDLWLARLGSLAVFIWAYAGTYVYSAIYENKNPLGLSESLLVGLGAYFVLGLGLMISALFMFLSIKVVNYVRLKIKQSSATKKNRSSPGNEGHGQSNQQNPQNNG